MNGRCNSIKARKAMVNPEYSRSGRYRYEMAGRGAGRSVKDQFYKMNLESTNFVLNRLNGKNWMILRKGHHICFRKITGSSASVKVMHTKK